MIVAVLQKYNFYQDMRATLITVFLITFGLFIGGLVYRVDGLMFGDKLSWSEAQSRSQMLPLIYSIESRFSALSETLALSLPQLEELKREYGRTSSLSKFQMVSLLRSGGGKDWSFQKSLFLEKSPTRSWAASYLALLLKSVDERDIKPGQFAVYSILSPERKPYLFVLHQLVLSADTGDVNKVVWMGVLTGPEFLQGFMDRSKGQLSQIFLVNFQGQALAHTVPEYVGNLLKEDPIVTEIMKAQVTSGSGIFSNLRGEKTQGFYEQVGKSNLFAVITTPLNDIFQNRDEVKWQLIFLGLGLSFVGVAAFAFLYRPEKEIVKVPVAATSNSTAPAAVQVTVQPDSLAAKALNGAGASSVPPKVVPPTTTSAEEIMKEKMQAFRQVSSALGHELSGPLSSILGHAQLLQAQLQKESGGSNEHINNINEQARRSREVLRKLLTFAGEATPRYEKTNLSKVLDKALRGLEPKFFRKGIHLSKDIQPIPDFEMPVDMLSKAIENVLTNAVEAMERAPAKELKITVFQKQGWVEIQISDSGEGIEANVVERIFDPFFSTRKGHAGLGLSMTMGIFKEINGSVFVDSKKGSGTTVRLMINPEMTAISGLQSQTGTVGGFSPEVSKSISATPVISSESAKAEELIVLDSSEVEEAIEGAELEEEKSDLSLAGEDQVSIRLETKKVSEDLAKTLPPPPASEVSASEATMILSTDSDFGPGHYTSKIDKPHDINVKRESKLDQVEFQIRKPGAKL